MAERFSGILEEMTIDQVRVLKPDVAVIPIGSTEPHGPALPYGTDSYRAEAIAYGATRAANGQGGSVVCLPTVRVSLNNNFRAFPFACRMQVSTFMSMLKDLVNMCEADGIEKVVFVNAHGGNPDVIRAAMRDLAAEDGAFVCMIQASSCASREARQVCEKPSDHAGEEETSQMLYLRPDLVHEAKIGDNPRMRPALEVLTEFQVDFVRPWHLYMPASAGGDASRASREKGRIVIDSSIEGTGRFLAELSRADRNRKFPYA
ncbi:MAG: creatininase family protein [Candidatus Latescibacteria bacterium]|nr:creatininase family protein [Candidatus Latescibacterota bacterium]